MEIIAQTKFIRFSPRKLRLAADLIRPLSIKQALTTLKHLPQKSGSVLLKTLKQAVANAVNNHHLNRDQLKIKTLEINAGPVYKRYQPVSRGRAHPIKKRTSHIKIILTAKEANGAKS